MGICQYFKFLGVSGPKSQCRRCRLLYTVKVILLLRAPRNWWMSERGAVPGDSGCSGSRGAGLDQNTAQIIPRRVWGRRACGGLAGADPWR